MQADRVHRWLSGDAYWALGRPRDVFERALAGSRIFRAYRGSVQGEQVAVARVVTDAATFAWLCDVYVARECRGQGVGSWFVGAVLARVEALGVARVILATRDAHEVYARHGFTPLAAPSTWMERDRRPASQRPPPEPAS